MILCCAGIAPERLALLPKGLQQLARRDENPQAHMPASSTTHVAPPPSRSSLRPVDQGALLETAQEEYAHGAGEKVKTPHKQAGSSADLAKPEQVQDISSPVGQTSAIRVSDVLDRETVVNASEPDTREVQAAGRAPETVPETELRPRNVDGLMKARSGKEAVEGNLLLRGQIVEAVGEADMSNEEASGSEDGSALRNPASPGCVYSGLQLELTPGVDAQGLEDRLAVESTSRADMEELRDIATAADPQCMDPQEGTAVSAVGVYDIRPGNADVVGGYLAGVQEDSNDQPPIQTLPPASQIDPSVLDALPLQMKREIERAYGDPFVPLPHLRAVT